MSGKLPPALRAFIDRRLASALQVEVLLLLRDRPDHAWTAEAVGRELRVEPGQADAALTHLAGQDLLDHAGRRYRLAPKRPEESAMVDELASAYAKFKVAVVSVVFSRPGGPVQDFTSPNAERGRRADPGTALRRRLDD